MVSDTNPVDLMVSDTNSGRLVNEPANWCLTPMPRIATWHGNC